MCKISVAMATYNGAKFIEEQMDTILAQTRKPDEVLFSDDDSTDNTVQIVENYIKQHRLEDTWKIHVNKKNKGYAKNFLDTILKAHGDIVFLCDQDDLWVEDRIEKMTKIMDEQTNINLLCSNLEPFYYEEDTRKWNPKDLAEMTNDGTVERPTLDYTFFHLKRSGCTMCLRKDFVKEIMPYWIPRWTHDDFLWKMAFATDSCGIIQYCSMRRRMHSNNASVLKMRTRDWRINQLQDFLDQYDMMREYVAYKNMDDEKLKVIDRNKKSIGLRQKVVEKRHLWVWLTLYLKYKDCYPRIKGLYLDLYISIFNKYKGAN